MALKIVVNRSKLVMGNYQLPKKPKNPKTQKSDWQDFRQPVLVKGNYQLLITNYKLPIINYQLPMTNYQKITIDLDSHGKASSLF